MTNARRLILLGGVILFVAGVIGLFVPVTISDGIGCGNAVHSDLSAAREQENRNIGNSPVVQQIPIVNQLAPKSEFVSSCNSALGHRRLWTIPLALVGFTSAGWILAQRRDNPGTGIRVFPLRWFCQSIASRGHRARNTRPKHALRTA